MSRLKNTPWQSALRPSAEAQRDEILEYLSDVSYVAGGSFRIGQPTRYPETKDDPDDVYRNSVYIVPYDYAIDIRENIPAQVAAILRERAAELEQAAAAVEKMRPLGFTPRADAAGLVFDHEMEMGPIPF